MCAADYHFESIGIYRIPEAARILGATPPLANGHVMPTSRLRHWIHASVEISFLTLPSQRRFITFQDLISMRMVAVLRSRGMTLREIRNTEAWVRDRLGLEWPFISRPLWTSGTSAFMQFGEHLVAVSRHGQQAMNFLKDWLHKVEVDMGFDRKGLASSWTPYTDISLNPKIQIGQPCISGTRIPSKAIWGKLQAGDSVEVVARLYDLTEEQVKHIHEWEARLLAA